MSIYIYDDRIEMYTPGGMYDGGKPIQAPTYTTEDFALAAKVSVSAIKKRIKSLVDKGIVTRIGANRGGFWKVQNPGKKE